ncbi:MAG: segregation/condensation protein A [Syntrophaceae bacterium]|nr:segregation/condensation protein A [Syntrophaceae bacterium]
MMGNDISSTGSTPYTVRLDIFEGPLDLLLHLIQKNQLDIADIPIAVITEQYLDYLKWMKVLNLDIAGEYLLMASTLLYIKSKMLLPTSSEEGEEEGEDPRAELVRRLLEYRKYKEAAAELEKKPLLERDVFVRPSPTESEGPAEEEKVEVSLFELVEAFRKILERASSDGVHEVVLDRVSVEERIQEILSLLQREKRSMAFHLLFPEGTSRRVMIVTFLAILELVKMKLIRIFQSAPFETIRVSLI